MSRTLDTSSLFETFAQGKEVNLPPDAQKRLEEMEQERFEKKKNKKYSEETRELPLGVSELKPKRLESDSSVHTQYIPDTHSIHSFLAHASRLFRKDITKTHYYCLIGKKKLLLDFAVKNLGRYPHRYINYQIPL